MAQNHNHGHGAHGHHPLVPISIYIKTLLALLVLTVVTVAASYFKVGIPAVDMAINIGIASVKAGLVMAFFMGLKYDTVLNRAFILSSFVALVILIAISAADLWVRPKYEPVQVKAAASALNAAELPKFVAGSPELVTKGKELYQINCAVCHGAEGKGDGAGGAALNPKPRNLHAEGGSWTHGNSAYSMYYTLAVGSPGTGMASYKSLLPEDRWALVHYLLTMGGAKVGKVDAKGEAVAKEEAAGGAAPKTTLPIDYAIERLVK